MRRRLLPILLSSAAVSGLAAQLPVDTVVVVEDTPVVAEYYRLVDVFGLGDTRIRGQSVFLNVTNLTCDPLDPAIFYYQSGATSFAGTWQATTWPMAEIGPNLWGPWSQVAADALAANDAFVFSLTNATVEATPRAGGMPVALFQLPGAVDVAAQPGFVYAAASGGGAVPIVEWDLQAGTQRTVANLAGVTAIAVAAPDLIVGNLAGEILRVDIATGAIQSTVSTGAGPIDRVEATRFGSAVYSSGAQLYSELAPGAPIFTSATRIRDFGVVVAEAASVAPFGEGCGALGTAARVTADPDPTIGNPSLGNAQWALGLEQAPASVPALFAIGTSRTQSSLGPLPLSLQFLGTPPNCRLLVSTETLVFTATTSTGHAQVSLPVPAAPALAGTRLYGQWALASPANAAGLELTEACVFDLR